MHKFVIIKALLMLSVLGLVACGGSDKKHNSSTSSAAASSTPASSVANSSVANSSVTSSSAASSFAASSSVASVSNVMEAGKEYPFNAETKIINTGTTELVVTKKYYWETQETKVVLQEGSATID